MKNILKLIFLCCIFYCTASHVQAQEKHEPLDHPTINFEISKGHVKLKGTEIISKSYGFSEVKISYIVKIDHPLSSIASTIYMSIQDKEGFELTRKHLSNVVGNYTGTLKGKFELNQKTYQAMSGVEIYCLVNSG